jgi:phenylalanyl-tRNA synthetase beta chain
MGGEESEISESTTDVLIESAYFEPDSVRRTARQLGMDTEASRRFERGADIEGVLFAQERCVQLICELAGGIASEDLLDIYPTPFQARTIYLRAGPNLPFSAARGRRSYSDRSSIQSFGGRRSVNLHRALVAH